MKRTLQLPAALLLSTTLVLGGCATSYGGAGLTGGYAQSRVNDRLMKVDFYGNGYIKADMVQSYALYRCAEIAKEKNKAYVVIYDSLRTAALDIPTPLPKVGSLGGKPSAYAFVAFEDTQRSGAQEVEPLLARLRPLVQGESKQ